MVQVPEQEGPVRGEDQALAAHSLLPRVHRCVCCAQALALVNSLQYYFNQWRLIVQI